MVKALLIVLCSLVLICTGGANAIFYLCLGFGLGLLLRLFEESMGRK